MHAVDPLKLRGYWTKSRQIFTWYSQIIADETFTIRSAVLQSVSKCLNDE